MTKSKKKSFDEILNKKRIVEPISEEHSEFTRLLLFILFLCVAGFIFHEVIFKRSFQGKIMRFVASFVPDD